MPAALGISATTVLKPYDPGDRRGGESGIPEHQLSASTIELLLRFAFE